LRLAEAAQICRGPAAETEQRFISVVSPAPLDPATGKRRAAMLLVADGLDVAVASDVIQAYDSPIFLVSIRSGAKVLVRRLNNFFYPL
jgi:hypothetical protein